MENDPVNSPSHYRSHPSGVEAITVCEHMSFNVGNAIKYLWRADLKGNAIEDLKKAAWYVARELERRNRIAETPQSKNNEKHEENAIKRNAYCRYSATGDEITTEYRAHLASANDRAERHVKDRIARAGEVREPRDENGLCPECRRA